MAFLFLASLANLFSGFRKDAKTKSMPEVSWDNKDLYLKDLASGMSMKEIVKLAEKGRYRLPPDNHPEPHRDTDGKIIIENCKLYEEDLLKYGGAQVGQWVKQGRYNLTPEELKKEEERIDAHIKRLINL